MVALWIILGLAIGGVIGFLIADRRSRAAQTEQAVAREQSRQLAAQLAELQQTLADHRRELSALQQDRAGLDAQLVAEKNSVAQHRQFHIDSVKKITDESARYESLRGELVALQNRHAATVAKLDAEKQSLVAEREHFTDTKARVREAFAELSGEALQKNSQQFFAIAEQAFEKLKVEAAGGLEEKKAAIAQLVQPMTALLDQYKQSLDKIEIARGEAFTSIHEKLAAVAATQQYLSSETRQLVAALRKPQGRGQWGELTLKRLFEMAGLAARVTFVEQQTIDSDSGRLRPDCIVTLPEQRQVVVDSKCVLDAFLDASAAADEETRGQHLTRHARQVRTRVDDLSSKAYWKTIDHTTDYVIMFLPGEAFLYAAVELDPQLIEYALRQRVLIASPTTLLGLLSVISHSWRQKAVEENAIKIRDAAEKLYTRLVKMVDHFERLGKALGNATSAYNDTLGSLESRVLSQARQMADLGVSKAKELSTPAVIEEDIRSLRPGAWELLADEGVPQLSLAESAALESATVRSAKAS